MTSTAREPPSLKTVVAAAAVTSERSEHQTEQAVASKNAVSAADITTSTQPHDTAGADKYVSDNVTVPLLKENVSDSVNNNYWTKDTSAANTLSQFYANDVTYDVQTQTEVNQLEVNNSATMAGARDDHYGYDRSASSKDALKYLDITNISFTDNLSGIFPDYQYNLTEYDFSWAYYGTANATTGTYDDSNVMSSSASSSAGDVQRLTYWAFLLTIVPVLTMFGNLLVCIAVYREKTLQTVTNYFIVSLAVADIMVATLVMPLAVYVEVSGFKHFVRRHNYVKTCVTSCKTNCHPKVSCS